MPAPIDRSTRSDIVYYAAQGHSQAEIAAAVDVSRNTVRKYLELTETAVEAANEPRDRLCAIIRDEYDWEAESTDEVRLDFLSM